GLSRDDAALARGMVLGEDGAIRDDMRDDFRRSGLAHLLAASGQNVALLFALALPLLMLARAGPRARVVALLALAVLYVPLAGGAATVATAPVMAHEFGRVSLAALPANVVALPAVAPVMWIGMGQAAAAQLTALGGAPGALALAVCRIAGGLDEFCLHWVAGV